MAQLAIASPQRMRGIRLGSQCRKERFEPKATGSGSARRIVRRLFHRRRMHLGDIVPVDEIVDEGLEVIGPAIAVVDIIGMLPDIAAQDRMRAACRWRAGRRKATLAPGGRSFSKSSAPVVVSLGGIALREQAARKARPALRLVDRRSVATIPALLAATQRFQFFRRQTTSA